MRLIDELLPCIQKNNLGMSSSVGPLTTTFILAMATPMIILPVERIYKPSKWQNGNIYADDSQIDPTVTSEVKAVMGLPHFENAPFFERSVWSYATRPPGSVSLAKGLDDELCRELSTQKGIEQAEHLPAGEAIASLRNALAHGGIAYLDEEGFHRVGNTPAKMFAFISDQKERLPSGGYSRNTIGVNVMRIDEKSFCAFLKSWSRWLRRAGLAYDLAA